MPQCHLENHQSSSNHPNHHPIVIQIHYSLSHASHRMKIGWACEEHDYKCMVFSQYTYTRDSEQHKSIQKGWGQWPTCTFTRHFIQSLQILSQLNLNLKFQFISPLSPVNDVKKKPSCNLISACSELVMILFNTWSWDHPTQHPGFLFLTAIYSKKSQDSIFFFIPCTISYAGVSISFLCFH